MDASGKVAIVTGGARRVGRAITLELARAGFDVAIHYHRSEGEARQVQRAVQSLGRRAEVFPADLAATGSAEQLIVAVAASLGRFDVLVNSASSFERLAFDQTDDQHWARVLAVNAIAPAMLARAAAQAMRAGGRGSIVNMIDILAERAVKGYAAYIASKAALASITRSLALELAPDITVNGIAPGIAEFPESYDQATRDRLIGQVPLKRAGSPEDVARLVRFLVTEGDYITGAIIPVDGGRSIRM